jgi:hypothetical protein
MKKNTGTLLLLGAMLLASAIGCNYDNLDLPDCDPNATASFSDDIQPILKESCNSDNVGCHAAGAASNVPLHDHASVKVQVDNGKLLSSIIWDGNASFMPSGSSTQIDSCSMNKVINWINDGALDN